jgi:predicted enzyme related to lactoylglutathione lyase
MSNKEVIGSIEWRDLTVEDASHISDFYAQVVGWEKEPVSMGDYDDFNMNNAEGTVAGICHARGGNSVIPPQWLMYVRVEDAELSAKKTCELGGEIIKGPTTFGGQTYFIIRDPGGAILAIFS